MNTDTRPLTDEEIIDALAEYFGLTEFRVIDRLRVVDLDREERRLTSDHG